MAITFKRIILIVTMIEDNKINRVTSLIIKENMIEEVELEEELKVVVIEKEVVLEKVTRLKI